MKVFVLLLMIVGCWANGSPGTKPHKDSLDCKNPKSYSLEEWTEPGERALRIVRDGTVLHSIKLLSGLELNGFGFNGAKKTKDGFELSIEFGSRIYYGKTFIFTCRQQKFYLSRIRVESFDKQNPAKWKRRTIRVRPNLPLEKFSITDFTLPVHPRSNSKESH